MFRDLRKYWKKLDLFYPEEEIAEEVHNNSLQDCCIRKGTIFISCLHWTGMKSCIIKLHEKRLK